MDVGTPAGPLEASMPVKAVNIGRSAGKPLARRVVYVVRSFPRLSQTFVLNELVSIESIGVPVSVLSIVRADEKQNHSQLKSLNASVSYLSETATFGIPRLVAHMKVMARHPARYLNTAWLSFRRRSRTTGYHSLGRWEAFDCAVRAACSLGVHRPATAKSTRLHAHFAHDPTLVAMLIHDLTGVEYSFTGHARDLTQIEPSALAERIAKAHDVVTICQMNVDFMRDCSRYVDHDKIHLVHNGVDLDAFKPATFRKVNGPVRVCTIGRLVEKKGFEVLIEAVKIVRQRGADLELDVIGDGPLRGNLQALIDDAGLNDAVQLCGERTQQQIHDQLPNYDLFALTPYVLNDGDRDGLPTVLVEAMACALPIVSTDVAGIPDLIHDQIDGLLCPPHNPVAVADALQSLAIDAELRTRLGAEARRTVERGFDLRANTLQLASLLTRLS